MTTTATAARTRTTRKPVCRKANYHRIDAINGTLVLTVGEGEKAEETGYTIECVRSDWGRAFWVAKYPHQVKPGEPSSYDVLIDTTPVDPEHPQDVCHCKGFLRWRHCRHVSALRALIATNKI